MLTARATRVLGGAIVLLALGTGGAFRAEPLRAQAALETFEWRAAFAAARRDVESGRITADYLTLLEASGFRHTPEVRQFLEALRSRSNWRLRAY